MSEGHSATAAALKAFIVFAPAVDDCPAQQSISLFNTLCKQAEETAHSRLVLSLQLIIHSQSQGQKNKSVVAVQLTLWAAATNKCKSAAVSDSHQGCLAAPAVAAPQQRRKRNVAEITEKSVFIFDCGSRSRFTAPSSTSTAIINL